MAAVWKVDLDSAGIWKLEKRDDLLVLLAEDGCIPWFLPRVSQLGNVNNCVFFKLGHSESAIEDGCLWSR